MNSNQKEEFRYIFAGMALQGMLASGKRDEDKMKDIATDAVLYASYLIDELEAAFPTKK